MTEDQLYELMQESAGLVECGAAYNSDIFHLLLVILAYYKVRGSEPEQMISNNRMRQGIRHALLAKSTSTEDMQAAWEEIEREDSAESQKVRA